MAKSASSGSGEVQARKAPGRRRTDLAPKEPAAPVAEVVATGVTTRKTPARRRTDRGPQDAVALAADRGRAAESAAAQPSYEEVQRRAFEIFLERGGEHGHDEEDWLEAERQLRGPRP